MPQKTTTTNFKIVQEKKINSVAISVHDVDFGSQLKMNHNDFQPYSTSHKINNNEIIEVYDFFYCSALLLLFGLLL